MDASPVRRTGDDHVTLPWPLFLSLVKGREDHLGVVLSCPEVLDQVLGNRIVCASLLENPKAVEVLRSRGIFDAVRTADTTEGKTPGNWLKEAFSSLAIRKPHKNEEPRHLQGDRHQPSAGSASSGEGIAISGNNTVHGDVIHTQKNKQYLGTNYGVMAISCGTVNNVAEIPSRTKKSSSYSSKSGSKS